MNGLSARRASQHDLIRASAGAGKTYQLTTRYLNLLRMGAEPGGILATTFTRKASGEIFARVLARLADAVDDEAKLDALNEDLEREWFALQAFVPLDAAACRAVLAELTRQLHRVNIGTLDSFFHRIVQTYRFELGVPVEPLILDEGGAAAGQLRLEAIEAMLGKAVDEDEFATLVSLLRQAHHDQEARSVTDAIDRLIGEMYVVFREAPDEVVWSSLRPKGLLPKDELNVAVTRLAAMETAVPLTADGKPRSAWMKALRSSLDRARADDWEKFSGSGIAAKLAAGEAKFSGAEIDDAWREAFAPLLAHAEANVLQTIANQCKAMWHLIKAFDLHFNRLRERQRVMFFSDLAHKLAHQMPQLDVDVLLDIYFRLDAQVQHLLIDEFQDTSIEQWRVLWPLVDEVTAQELADRTFFCVGDTKQSIYGWRGGTPELFDEVEAKLLPRGLGVRSLSKSWRSSPVVLDAVNNVFMRLSDIDGVFADDDMPAVGAWGDMFNRHEAVKALPGYALLMSTPSEGGDEQEDEQLDIGGDDEATPPLSHMRCVAGRIAALHRDASAATIGVLARTNNAAQSMLFELRRLGLPASGEGGNVLTDSPAVEAVLATFTLADHPGDTLASFHVANSPVGEMLGLHEPREPRIDRIALTLREHFEHRGYADVLAEWTRKLAPSCDERNLRRLTQLVELAEQYEPMVSLRPSHFVEFVRATAVEESARVPIRVMTIHRSKGLEFDAVVLADLDHRFSNRFDVLVERDGVTEPITAVYRGVNESKRSCAPQIESAYTEQRQRRRMEDLCTLYVAMTRAKYALYMFVRPRGQKQDGSFRKLSLSAASIVRETLRGENENVEGEQILYEKGEIAWFNSIDWPVAAVDAPHGRAEVATDVTALPELVAPSKQHRRHRPRVSPSSLEAGGELRGSDLLASPGDAARQRGTLIHLWFEQVGFVDDPHGVPNDAVLLAAAREKMEPADDDWLAEQLGEFRAMLASDAIQQQLRRNGATELWREQDFVVVHEQRTLSGTMDRVAIHRNAEGNVQSAVVIDFKTDGVNETTMDETIARYAPQMRTYRAALTSMLSLPPDRIAVRLLFVGQGMAVQVQSDETWTLIETESA